MERSFGCVSNSNSLDARIAKPVLQNRRYDSIGPSGRRSRILPAPVFPNGHRSASHFVILLLLFLPQTLAAGAQAGSQVSALLRDGQKALDAGDFSRALQDFEQALQVAPQNPEVN